MFIQIENISKTYNKNKHPFVALHNISIDIKNGEFIVFLGPSGCGKSTLLDIIAGLKKAESGNVFINGETNFPCGKYSSMVFQDYALIPWKTVERNLTYVMKINKIPVKKRKELINSLLIEVGLEDFKDSFPNQLSGGMKQRVAIARALVSDTEILLMDEPFAALDAITRESLQDTFVDLVENKRKTIIFVTHSIDEALKIADRIIIFSASPGTIKKEIKISVSRKGRDLLASPILKIKKEILKVLNGI